MENKLSVQFKIAAAVIVIVCTFSWICERWPYITRQIARTKYRAYTAIARTFKVSVRPYTGRQS